MFSSILQVLLLMAALPFTLGEYYRLGGACAPSCEVVYKEADMCKLNKNPVLSFGPLGFNSSCLCEPDTFRENAPACIDCLFRGDIEEGSRDSLLRGMDGCTKSLELPACPNSCQNVTALMASCGQEDAASSAAAVEATMVPTEGAMAPTGGDPLANPDATATDAPTPVATEGSAAGKRKKVKEDFTKKCVCKPENQEVVQTCYDCLKNYDVNVAEQVILPVRRCDPNYGIQGPLYRYSSLPGDDDDDSLGGVKGRKNRKLKNFAPSGVSGVFTLIWWIGIQILCVLGAIVYFII